MMQNKKRKTQSVYYPLDKILVALSAIIGIGYALNDPLSKIWNIDLFGWAATLGA